MKNSINLIFIILLLCSVGVFASKGRSRKARSRMFAQQDEKSVSISSYLSAPASTESSGCFFDTSENLIEILEEKVKKYSQICNLETNSELQGVKELLQISRKLGEIKGKILTDPKYLLTLADKQTLSSDIFTGLHEILSADRITNEIINKMLNTVVKGAWELFAQNKGYPVFMRDKAWSLARFNFAHNYLSVGYVKQDECLPVTSEIKEIIDLVVIDLNEEGTTLVSNEVYERVKIDPYGFDYGGYALAFWVKEDNADLNDPVKLIQGFINNKEEFTFSLQCCRVNHVLSINGNDYNIGTAPTCTEYAFVLITFEKDCDSYLMNTIVRQSHSNTRYNITAEKIPAQIMENLQLSLTGSDMRNIYLYSRFKYSEEQELRILSAMTDSFFQPIVELLAKCDKKEDNCLYYSTEKQCQVCEKGSFIYKKKCYIVCPDGTFTEEDQQCTECDEGCVSCTDKSTCGKCGEGYYLYKGKCTTKCPAGTFSVNGECKPCTDNCLSCIGESECGGCDEISYLYKGKCYKKCPPKTFLDPIQKVCSDCNKKCSECDSFKVCKGCEEGYYLTENGECLESCPSGTRKNPQTRECDKCRANCKTCESSTEKCDVCEEKFYLYNSSECVNICPDFQVSFKGICISCGDKENCLSCQSDNVNKCKKCKAPRVLRVDGTCAIDCGDNYYPDADRVCRQCQDKNCLKCSDKECYQCGPTFSLYEKTKCLNECPDGYVDIDGVCIACENSKCKQCDPNDKRICTRCHYPYWILKEGECVEDCGDYYYQDSQDCKSCPTGCIDCNDQYTCNRCDEEYYFKNGACVQDCGIGYRANSNGNCEPCSVTGCASCQNEKTTCDYCIDGDFLFNNVCYEKKCPPGSYLPSSSSKICEPCQSKCQKCSSANTCDECSYPYVLQGSVCQSECEPHFYSDSKRICRSCDNKNCLKCPRDPYKCTECPEPLLLYNDDCIEKCPDGTFANGKECDKCGSNCKTCEGKKTQCTSCPEGLLFDAEKEEKCVSECDDGKVRKDGECVACKDKRCKVCKTDNLECCTTPFYPYVIDGCEVKEECPTGKFDNGDICDNCMTGCDKCNNANTCTECSQGYYLLDGKCVKECGDGFIEYEKKCIACAVGCKKCQPGNSFYCTACPDDKFLYNGYCLDTCPNKYWGNNDRECKPCDDPFCSTCSNEGKTCDRCQCSYVLLDDKCQPAPCPEQTVNINGVCHKCQVSNCKYCDTSVSKCDTCLDDYAWVNDIKCSKECPSGTYKTSYYDYPNYYYCEDCPENCDKCENSYTCNVCKSGFVLQGSICKTQCNEGYYNVNGVCQKCKFSNCKECTSTDCLKCSSITFLYDNIDSGKDDECVFTCPDGTYADTYEQKCKKCGLHCSKCKDADSCEACDIKYLLMENKTCTDECPDGTVEVNGKCKVCKTSKDCSKCKSDLVTCERCSGKLFLKNNECVESCGSGYYSEDSECKPCIENCDVCRNGKECDTCLSNYFLYNSKCIQPCETGYFGADGRCKSCPTNCQTCDNENICKVCKPGYILQDDKCVKSCDAGYFQLTEYECKKCSQNCLECSSLQKCNKCIPNYYLLNGFCVDKCLDGQYPDGTACVTCTSDCETCDSVSTCRKCSPEYYRYQKRCTKTCPPGTYKNQATRECDKCVDNCDICEDGEHCKQCGTTYSLYDSGCVKTCPDGYSSFNRICDKCEIEDCYDCSNDKSDCQKCKPNYFKYNKKCLQKCPEKTFADITNLRCIDCADDCASCSNKSTCDSCPKDMYLEEGRCVNECSEGLAPVNGKCEECTVKFCKTCESSNLGKCLTCKPGYFLKILEDGSYTCTTSCGDGFFEDGTKCSPCPNNCKTCSSTDTCDVCGIGFVLLNGQCVERCPKYHVERNRKCFKCEDERCLTCDLYTLKTCYKCEFPYKLKDDDCVAECGIGYFDYTYDDITECSNCPQYCASCPNQYSCNKCIPGYVLHEGKCIQGKCPSQYVDVDGVCKKCGPNCKSCSALDQNHCDECLSLSYLNHKNECGECGDGYVPSDGKCVKCSDDNCIKCSPFNKCVKCIDEMPILDGVCKETCGEGYYKDLDFICKQCDDYSTCSECYQSNPAKCKKCKPNLFLYNYKCVNTCPTGYYGNSDGVCQKCSSNCEKCQNEETCISCDPKYALDNNNRCVDCDEPGEVKVNGVCKKCPGEKCLKCNPESLDECTECDATRLLYNGKCYSNCPVGTYEYGRFCFACEDGCDECKNSYTCTKCSPKKVLYLGDCLETCPTGWIPVDGECKRCKGMHCTSCSAKDLSVCEVCSDGYILYDGICTLTCPIGTFYSAEAHTCKKCRDYCDVCTNEKDCSQCDYDHYLMRETNECVENCGDGYYIEDYEYCQKCEGTNCKTCCPNDPKLCLSCPEGFYVTYYSGDPYPHCVKECQEGKYPTEENGVLKCKSCLWYCKTCTDATTCKSCINDYKFMDGQCHTYCPKGTAERNGECLHCADENCDDCNPDNLSECNICSGESKLYNKQCVAQCPPYHYVYQDSYTKKCERCPDNCDTCDGSQCKKCLPGFYFEEGTNNCVRCELPNLVIGNICHECKVPGCDQCVPGNDSKCYRCSGKLVEHEGLCKSECPIGYFRDGSTCSKCSEGCEECTNADNCVKCSPPLVRFGKKCRSGCPTHTRLNEDNVCESCSDSYCIKCTKSVDICEECDPEYLLYKDQCRTDCPKSTTVYGNTCKDCPEDCLTCEYDKCTSCIPGKYLKDGKCVVECGNGFYQKDGQCHRCTDSKCQTCPGDVCNRCLPGSYLRADNSCNNDCPDGFYGNPETGKCEPCAQGCKRCTDANTCKECIASFSMYNNKCVNPCPRKTTSVNGECVRCNQQSCAVCSPNDPNVCLECEEDAFLYQGLCVDKCGDGTFVFEKTCKDCDPKCEKCTDEKTCIDCKDNYFLDEGECKNDCPFGKAKVGEECKPCKSERCKECSSDLEKCYNCYDLYFLFGYECYTDTECPTGTYPDPKTRKCERCAAGCQNCTKDKCILCKRGYYYHQGECLVNCPDGFFEDCESTSRKCVPCDESCDKCILGTNQDCITCKTGYVMYNDKCISDKGCPTGTYFDGSACTKCQIPYCAECSTASSCSRCNRGFNIEDGKCVEGNVLTSLIQDHMIVDQYTSSNETLRQNEIYRISDYEGTGVGSQVVTVTFYLRSLQPSLDDDLIVLALVNPNSAGYNWQFVIDKKEKKCKVKFTDRAGKAFGTLDISSCNYNDLYEWKFFSITLAKHGSNFVAVSNTFDESGKLLENTIDIEGNSHNSIIEITGSIILNYFEGTAKKTVSNGAFQIGKLNIMDYYPDEAKLVKLASYKPSNCDYFCSTCKDVCLSCNNGAFPTDNRCEGSYFIQTPELFSNPTEEAISFRDTMGEFTSDAYGFTQWMYINSLEHLNFLIYQINIGSTSYATCEIVNRQIVYNGEVVNHEPFEAKKWYFIVVTTQKEGVNVYVRDTNGYNYTQKITSQTFVRQFNEFTYTLHVNREGDNAVSSVYKGKVFINNIPSDIQIKSEYEGLSCPSNCLTCNEQLMCSQCVEGFKIEEGICIEESPAEEEAITLVGLFDLWNRDVKQFELPNLDKISLAFNIRKKTHSNIYNSYTTYNILSYSNGESIKSLVTETFVEEFTSQYSIFGNGKSESWHHNYNDEAPDFITFVILINKNAKTITFYVNDYSISKTIEHEFEFNDEMVTLYLGDANGYEMNTEVSNFRIFNGLIASSTLKTLQKYPQFPNGGCIEPDFATNLCKLCINDEEMRSKPTQCRTEFLSFSPSISYDYSTWEEGEGQITSISLLPKYSANVNSDSYSITGYFELFKVKEGALYRIACLHNDGNKLFKPTHNRGHNLICLDAAVVEGKIHLKFIVNDGGESISKTIENFTFSSGEYVSFIFTVNAADLIMNYYIESTFNSAKNTEGQYKFKYIPERLQESAMFTIMGYRDGLDKTVYQVPHMISNRIGFIPNHSYNAEFAKDYANFVPLPECSEGCSVCSWDNGFTYPICLDCQAGFEKKVNDDFTVTCTQSDDHTETLTDELITGAVDLSIGDISFLSKQFGLYFQIQLNFAYWEYEKQVSIVDLGFLTIFVYKGELYITINQSTPKKIPLYDPYDTWNHVLISLSKGKLTVQVLAGSFSDKVEIDLSTFSILDYILNFTGISINPVGYFISFNAVSLTTSTDINAVKKPVPNNFDKCGLNCALCEDGECKVCEYGTNDDGTCKSIKQHLTSGYYRPNDDDILTTEFLVESDRAQRYVKIKSWTYQFNVEYDELYSKDMPFLDFGNFNGYTTLTSTINVKSGKLVIRLWPIDGGFSSHEEITLQLTDSPKSPYFFYNMSYDHKTKKFKVLFGENSSNYAYQEYTVKGFLGYFGIELAAVIKSEVPAYITNHEFIHSYAEGKDTMVENLKNGIVFVQKDCKAGTPRKCSKCSKGKLTSNGLCIPEDVDSYYLGLFASYHQVNAKTESKEFSMEFGEVKEYTLSFLFRLSSPYSDTLKLFTFSKGTMNIEVYYFGLQDKLTITSDKYAFIIKGGILSKLKSLYDWISISVGYDGEDGKAKLKIVDMNDNVIVEEKRSDLNKEKYSAGKYVFSLPSTDAGSYEIAGIVFFDEEIIDDIDDFRYNSIKVPEVGCYEMVSGVCVEVMREPISLIRQDASEKLPLFNQIKAADWYTSFNQYLITFEIDIQEFKKQNYLANPNTLAVFTDGYDFKYDKNWQINPTNIREGLTFYLINNEFRVRAPPLPWKSNVVEYVLKFDEASFDTNIIISALGNAKENTLKLLITFDGNSYLYDASFSEEQTIHPISLATLVYYHPAIKNMTINFNTQKIDHDYVRSYSHLPIKCLTIENKPYCSKCKYGFNFVNPGCAAKKQEKKESSQGIDIGTFIGDAVDSASDFLGLNGQTLNKYLGKKQQQQSTLQPDQQQQQQGFHMPGQIGNLINGLFN